MTEQQLRSANDAKYEEARCLISGGMSVKLACAKVDLNEQAYYRRLRKDPEALAPAIRDDWSVRAQSWKCFIFVGLEPHVERSFRLDIGMKAREIFKHSQSPRRTADRPDLVNLIEALGNVEEAYSGLDPRTSEELEDLGFDHGTKATYGSTFRQTILLKRELSEYLEAYREHLDETGVSRGGRNTDERIPCFVMALAGYYNKYTGKEPFHTTNPSSGEMMSEFNTFVEDAFSEIIPELKVGNTVLREAMREAAATLDWSYDFHAEQNDGQPPETD